MSKRDLTSKQRAHYLRLWTAADKLLKQPDNPCQIKAVGDGTFTCTRYATPNKELCCIDCEYLGPNGCTAKSLGCKLGWCCTGMSAPGQDWFVGDDDYTILKHPTVVALAKLRQEADDLDLPLGIRWQPRELEGK